MRWLAWMFLLIPLVAYPVNVKTYIPPGATKYMPLVKSETIRLFPGSNMYSYYGALIEHESCVYLTSSLCWNPASELKTAKEQGVGFGQTTRAYDKHGKVRMDTLTDLRTRYSDELKELSWDNIKTRPDLQIRSIILLDKSNYDALYQIKDPYERRCMADASYNKGRGNVQNDRRLCGLTKGCNPQKWFNNAENTCSSSKKALYGNRSPCDIGKNHVRDVMLVRLPKYKKAYP